MRTLMVEELVWVSGGWPEPIPPEPEPEKCNNGWGNGENCAPGNSLEHQPKFEDPDTGPSPSNSAASGGGDR
jgi:hypothetical protein